jgi:endonuclease YncB( thermonuclease family)
MVVRTLFRIGQVVLIGWSLVAFGDPVAAYKCRIDVVDGDTVRTCEGLVRLRGCNAPERFMTGGPAARKRLDELLLDATSIEVACHRDRPCRDFLLRQVCDLLVDGQDVCDVLVAEGRALPQRGLRSCQMQRPLERTPVYRWSASRRL